MKICVKRVSGRFSFAKDTNPRVLLFIGGSSFRLARCQAAWTAVSPFRPNCAMNPGRTRKNRVPS